MENAAELSEMVDDGDLDDFCHEEQTAESITQHHVGDYS